MQACSAIVCTPITLTQHVLQNKRINALQANIQQNPKKIYVKLPVYASIQGMGRITFVVYIYSSMAYWNHRTTFGRRTLVGEGLRYNL
jgi:hypothetical protein